MIALVLDTSTPAVSAGLVQDGRVLAERVVVDGRRHGELLALGVGPGPFTGLRVGIMTAVAFGDARGIPVIGVCSLDGLSAPRTGVVTDARRKEVYWAAYDGDGVRVDGPHVTAPDVARAALAGLRVVGDGAQLHGFATDPEPRYPSLSRLAEVAATTAPLPLTPLYLRRPDAQEMTAR